MTEKINDQCVSSIYWFCFWPSSWSKVKEKLSIHLFLVYLTILMIQLMLQKWKKKGTDLVKLSEVLGLTREILSLTRPPPPPPPSYFFSLSLSIVFREQVMGCFQILLSLFDLIFSSWGFGPVGIGYHVASCPTDASLVVFRAAFRPRRSQTEMFSVPILAL